MHVGVCGNSASLRFLADALTTAGHTVLPVLPAEDVHTIGFYDLLLIDAPPHQLPTVIDAMTPHIRPGQIAVHTTTEVDTQVMLPLMKQGAVVGAISHVAGSAWMLDSIDEMGDAVLSALVTDLHLRTVSVPRQHRGDIGMALRRMELASAIFDEAKSDLLDMLPEESAEYLFKSRAPLALSADERLRIFDLLSGIAQEKRKKDM